MELYEADVTYTGIIIERTVVEAETKEEAIEKIKNGDIVDVIDMYTEQEQLEDIDFF